MNYYLGEIRLFGFNFAPKGWAFCNGQSLPISQNQALFSLLGTSFGGNGISTFGLPNYQGRVAVGQGRSYVTGQSGGELQHTLSIAEMPAHTHVVSASTDPAASYSPKGAYPANASPTPLYAATSPTAGMSSAMISPIGGGQPHDNTQPYLALNYCIALAGIFPSRN